jgi:multimeric flavodoxin WrbA
VKLQNSKEQRESIKVLGILGSPRRQGNTEILLDSALAGAVDRGAKVEKVLISEMEISPCKEIYACLEAGRCAIQDDMQILYEKLLAADHLVFASPIFFYGVTAQAKAMVDRCQALWVKRYILGMGREDTRTRRGVFISVGATRGKNLFDGAVLTVKYFYDAIGVNYINALLVNKVDTKARIREHPSAIQDAFLLGQQLVFPSAVHCCKTFNNIDED